jgi:hypothetical protein
MLVIFFVLQFFVKTMEEGIAKGYARYRRVREGFEGFEGFVNV